MGFSHLLRTEATLATFRARFEVPLDVDIEYCPKGNIENDQCPRVAFFPLMVILEGGVRFPMDPLLVRTLSVYCLCPNQLPPNSFKVVSCISLLNNLYGLCLNHNDIKFMYNMCGNTRLGYYLKVQDTVVRIISCVPDSNKNLTREYVKVSDNRLVGEHPYLTSPQEIGRYPFLVFPLTLSFSFISSLFF